MKQKGKFSLFDFSEFCQWFEGLQVKRAINIIQNHHTWLPDYVAFRLLPDHFHWLESMENFQVTQNGFAQIAQNFTTFPDGTIAVCRPLDVIPAGIKGANQYGVCIEHLGNFDTGKDTMTEDHKNTIVKLNALLCKKFSVHINTTDIVYHHWYDIITGKRTDGTGTVKTCPGTNFFGGNSVQNCNDNFLPLVTKALQTL